MGCNKIITNINGIPYLSVKSVNVTTENVNLNLGFANIPPVGYFTIRVGSAIPEGTTDTLSVQVSLNIGAINGGTRLLTTFGGTAVTAADIAGTGVLTVFYDRFNDILQLVSTPV